MKRKETYKAVDDFGIERDYERRVYITANADGNYTLPKEWTSLRFSMW